MERQLICQELKNKTKPATHVVADTQTVVSMVTDMIKPNSKILYQKLLLLLVL